MENNTEIFLATIFCVEITSTNMEIKGRVLKFSSHLKANVISSPTFQKISFWFLGDTLQVEVTL